ncbi:hypothetical protein DEM34_05820 [Spiribacter halobius]|uniref:SHOCT domain-containing protein n=2 Tax=Sediminicurvatus halobius TaxID=2182432 RepID=A0A2U2N4H6_9GAMM|nr:hypothetical protein DEM34_05820 [Spiribacter halobius]
MKRHWVLPGLPAGVLASAPIQAWAQSGGGAYERGYGPHMMDWGAGWYGMFLGPLMMILVLVVVVAVAVMLVRWLGGSGQGPQPPQHSQPGRTPLDILKERYARGEIDTQEFEERRRVLGE